MMEYDELTNLIQKIPQQYAIGWKEDITDLEPFHIFNRHTRVIVFESNNLESLIPDFIEFLEFKKEINRGN